MQKVKVKAYGILEFTKSQYLITQASGLVFILLSLAVFYYLDLMSWDNIFIANLDMFLLAILALEVVETFFMLRKFKLKEQEQTSQCAAL